MGGGDTGSHAVISLHIGGASTASVVVSIVVIFFMIFAVSFAFGSIPEGHSRFSGESLRAWLKASAPRLVVSGVFAGALGVAAFQFGDDPSEGASTSEICETGVPPLSGQALTEVRLLGAIDGMEQMSAAAERGDAERVQTLFVTLDAHNVTHDIDRPLRERDRDLARDLCLSVIVLENQMAGTLDTEVIAREAAAIAGRLQEARGLLDLAAVAITPVPGASVCTQPLGAVTAGPLTPARIGAAAATLREIASQAQTLDAAQLGTLFFGDAHNITHDIDGPLRAADDALAVQLCESVYALEGSFGAELQRDTIERESATSADLLEEAGRALGITR